MRKFGLIGKALKHSFSKRYFNDKFRKEVIDATYELFELGTISELEDLVAQEPFLEGLNITIPYKEGVLPFLDWMSEEARTIGAVNVIKIIRKKGKIWLKGFNTDAPAFLESLRRLRLGNRALILGTGGAAKAVAFAFCSLGIPYLFVSRTPERREIGYDDLDEKTIKTHQIIVNATPLGMFPDTKSFPRIPYHFLTSKHLLYDLVYNPKETEFLRRGREMEARTTNGLAMLEMQAEYSWRIWNK